MKDQVFMSPNNGQLVLGVPLFRNQHGDLLSNGMVSYSICLTTDKPMAYVIHADKLLKPQVLAAWWVEKNMINLGDL